MTEIILTSFFLIVLRYFLRGRIHPTVQYALWLLVAARLLIPGTLFTAPVSIMGATGELQSAIGQTLPDGDKAPLYTHSPVYTIPDNLPSEKVEHSGDTVITYYPPQATYPTPVKEINRADAIWKAGIALAAAALLLSNLTFYNRLRKKSKTIIRK